MQITITAEEFERKCLELLDEVAEKGLIVVITKDGRPIAKMIPISPDFESSRAE